MSMSSSRPRRLSTGDRPPLKVRPEYMIEPIPPSSSSSSSPSSPTNSSIPGFSAWIHDVLPPFNENHPRSYSKKIIAPGGGGGGGPVRPRFGLPIYDARPKEGQGGEGEEEEEGKLAALAEKLHRVTREIRESHGRGERDRVDVWGVGGGEGGVEEGGGGGAGDEKERKREREKKLIHRCRAHLLSQIAASNDNDFPMPILRADGKWERGMVIIDRDEEWVEGEEDEEGDSDEEEEEEEEEGPFLVVFWGMLASYVDELRQCRLPGDKEVDEKEGEGEVVFRCKTLRDLGEAMGMMRDGIERCIEGEEEDDESIE